MADINKLDLTVVDETLQAMFRSPTGFELTTYADGATIALASSTSEEIGDQIYQVQGGTLTITDSGVANGTVYVHVKDDGDGTASAYLSVNSGSWDASKSGYYYTDGAKVIAAMTKAAGPVYSNRGRMLSPLDQSKSIGEIFAIHPDCLVLPNPYNFALCDGGTGVDTNFISNSNDTNVPDLDDDRYLKGGTAFDKDASGSNTHVHQWYKTETADTTADKTYNSSGAETNILTDSGVASGEAAAIGGAEKASGRWLNMNAYTKSVDGQPKHFEVLFYIRIR